MVLKSKSGFLTFCGNEGRLLMDSRIGDQVVLVTQRALEAVADPPRADEFRLQEHIDTFSRIASDKYDRKQFDRPATSVSRPRTLAPGEASPNRTSHSPSGD